MGNNQSPYFHKTVASSVPTVLCVDNGVAITKTPYFTSIAGNTKKSIEHSHKHFLQMKMVVQYLCNLLYTLSQL